MILDRISFRRFLGLSYDDKTPDETTIWRFRERLTTSGRASDLFDHATSEETWDTESLVHHRTYPEERLIAHH